MGPSYTGLSPIPGLGTAGGNGSHSPGSWATYHPDSTALEVAVSGRSSGITDLPFLSLSVSLEWGSGLPPRAAKQFRDKDKGSSGAQEGALPGALGGLLL